MDVGARVGSQHPAQDLKDLRADCGLFHLGNPFVLTAMASTRADETELNDLAIPLFVHSSLAVNLASCDLDIWQQSQRVLEAQCASARRIGASGVVVHAGYEGNGDLEAGGRRWQQALARAQYPVPLFIENTVSPRSQGRDLKGLTRLFDMVDTIGVGLCLDICHLHAVGESVDAVVSWASSRGINGLIELSDSQDARGSCRDRHARLGRGHVRLNDVLPAVSSLGWPIICETPRDSLADDLAWVRAHARS